jgi:hypothetical protein
LVSRWYPFGPFPYPSRHCPSIIRSVLTVVQEMAQLLSEGTTRHHTPNGGAASMSSTTSIAIPPIPTHEQTRYLSAYKLGAVLIAGSSDGAPPIMLGAAVDIGRALTAMRRKAGSELVPLHIAWADSRRAAERVVELILHHELKVAHDGGGLLHADVALVRETVERVAARLACDWCRPRKSWRPWTRP